MYTTAKTQAVASRILFVQRLVALCSVLVIVTAAVSGCTSEPQEQSSSPPYQPTASIQDIMLELIDPAADTIWESVATIVTFDNIEERRPSTD